MAERLQIAFLGMNEGDDPKNLPPGTLVRAENVRMDKARRLYKRRGVTGLAKTALSGSNPAAGKRIVQSGKKLAITDGATLWTYAETLAKWAPVDRIPSWKATRRGLVDSSRSATAADVAISGDMLVTLYVAGGVFVKVDSLTTGSTILGATPTDASVNTSDRSPRVLISGGVAYLLYATTTGVKVAKLDLTTLVVTVGALLFSNGVAYGLFDAAIGTPTAGVATLYVAYELTAGVDRTRMASFTLSTLAAVATLDSLGTSIHAVCIAFCPLAQRVHLIYSSYTSGVTRTRGATTALVSTVSTTTWESYTANYAFIVEMDATYLLIGWARNSATDDGAAYDMFISEQVTVAAHTPTVPSRRKTYNVSGLTKPWTTGGRWFVGAVSWAHGEAYPGVDGSLAQPSTIVLEVETASSLTGAEDGTHPHVATLQNQTGWISSTGGTYTPITSGSQYQAATDSSGNVWLPSPYRNREPASYASPFLTPIGWDVFKLEASGGSTFSSALLGASSLVSGASPVWDDGATAMPLGFTHSPVIWAVSATAGGSMVAGTYSYVATYAWRDAHGVLHRSAPSAPVTGTAAAADLSMTITITTSSITSKVRTTTLGLAPNPVTIELWRTVVGGTGNHYRLSYEPTYQALLNDHRAGTVSVVDVRADASIVAAGLTAVPLAAQAQLYTDLGELENIPPPSLTYVTTYRGRLAGIGPDQRTLWFSKDSTIDPTIAPGFNEALTLAFASDKTALASLDTVLVVFGSDTIDVVQGDGPDDTGSNSTWSIQGVQTDVGCTNPRSVVTTPVGVMFESRRGIELLDRGLGVSEVLGRFVVDTLSSYSTITSAVLVAEENEVRFTCDNGSTGIVLAYDYLNKLWFTRKYTDASDTAVASVRFVDAALIDGVYTLLTAGGQVYRETSSSYLDGGTAYVETDILLAPISAQPGRSGWSNDNLAWQRAKDLTVMGTSVANHDLSVSFAMNYANTFAQTHRFLANTAGTPTAVGVLEKARVTIATQKCQSIQIRIRDLAPTGTANANAGAGVVLESLCLRVGALGGPAKTTAGEQA